MPSSVFDIFKIGLGPSNVSTSGPMIAARRFVETLKGEEFLERTTRVGVDLHGSFQGNGKMPAMGRAVMLGLQGADPETIDLDSVDRTIANIRKTGRLRLWNRESIIFDPHRDLVYHSDTTLSLPFALRFTAYSQEGLALLTVHYSLTPDGSVLSQNDCGRNVVTGRMPYPFSSASELGAMCRIEDLAIWQIVLRNERALSSESQVSCRLDRIWSEMRSSVERGMSTTGVLPGELGMRRRAPGLGATLRARKNYRNSDEASHLRDWLSVFATAAMEENAAGGRIVMAPTAGAAGVLAAVGMYFERFEQSSDRKGIVRYLLSAGALGILFREHIEPGAEIGCRNEIGVAASMAAGALVAAGGGSNVQVMVAAEIALDRHLGETHPLSQHLVQIPSLERNATGAILAVEAARQAVNRTKGTSEQSIYLDQLIRTVFRLGADPSPEEKEIPVATV